VDDHPLSAARKCLFHIFQTFAAALRPWWSCSIPNPIKRNATVNVTRFTLSLFFTCLWTRCYR
jgi:hypothetical protein